jgi:HK97 family phage major capsid protein
MAHENVALRQQRAKLAADMGALANEFNSKPAPTEAETQEFNQKFDRMDADQKALLERITRMERAAELEAETRAQGTQKEGAVRGQMGVDEKEERQKAYKTAYDSYLRFGMRGLNDDQRAMLRSAADNEAAMFRMAEFGGLETRATLAAEGTPTGGAYPSSTSGFFVPVDFQHQIETAMKWYGQMLDAAKIITTSTGAPLMWPSVNDTTVSGALLGENQQVSSVNVNVNQIQFGSYKFTSNLVLVSIELLQDSAFDLNEYLKDLFAIRLGRALNTYFTVGTGTNQPTGVITAATQASYGGSAYTNVGANDNDGVSGANTIGTDDLLVLQHSVDRAYRPQASYMMNDLTLASMRKLKDKYGRPLWQVSVAEGEPDKIDGRPFYINNDMAAIQTAASSPAVTNKTMLFGDFSKYIIRRVKDMTILRLEERYADFGQVGFIGFARYDGNLIDAGTHPMQYSVNTY